MSDRRIRKELASYVRDPLDGCTLSPTDDFNLLHWQGTIFGPEDSAYEGGIFFLDIRLPDLYPLEPPKCTFKTKIYHPNINSEGKISLDILKYRWSPALTILSALKGIMLLLTTPNFDDPLVPSISQTYRENPKEYEAIAREWTQKYAT